MKNFRLLSLSILPLLFVACGGEKTLTYSMTFDMDDSAKRLELTNAAQRMIERRMASIEVKGTVVAAASGEGGTVTITLSEGPEKKVRTMLEDPFTIELKASKTPVNSASTEQQWKETGIENDDLEWVRVIGDRATGKIGAELVFTAAGRTKLQQMFSQYKGGEVGIFIRGVLMSKLSVDSGEIGEKIIITGIPSPAVAQVFADDVNVGLHVAFSPL